MLVTALGLLLSSPRIMAQDQVPATAKKAAEILDLTRMKLIDPTAESQEAGVLTQSIATLSYQAKGSVDKIAQAMQKSLTSDGWKVQEGASINDAYATAAFQKNGFTLSLNVMPGNKPNEAQVTLNHLGNVDFAKLPLPTGAKILYSMPSMILFETDRPPAETKEAIQSALADKDWEPFGDTTASFFLRKNAVRLQVMANPSPTDPKKSMVQISGELMAADFPSLTEVENLQYSSVPTQLSFDCPMGKPESIQMLGDKLKAMGWKPTTEQPIKIDFRDNWIFRNDSKDLTELEISEVEGKTRIRWVYQTAAQADAVNQKVEAKVAEKVAEKKAKQDAEMKRKAKANATAIVIEPLASLTVEKASEKEIVFTSKSGAARKPLQDWLKKRQADAWELETLVDAKEAGEWKLKKGDIELQISLLDPGFIPGTVTIALTSDGKLELKK
jgi:hypothetical protein